MKIRKDWVGEGRIWRVERGHGGAVSILKRSVESLDQRPAPVATRTFPDLARSKGKQTPASAPVSLDDIRDQQQQTPLTLPADGGAWRATYWNRIGVEYFEHTGHSEIRFDIQPLQQQ